MAYYTPAPQQPLMLGGDDPQAKQRETLARIESAVSWKLTYLLGFVTAAAFFSLVGFILAAVILSKQQNIATAVGASVSSVMTSSFEQLAQSQSLLASENGVNDGNGGVSNECNCSLQDRRATGVGHGRRLA